jgi:hypothetical protein
MGYNSLIHKRATEMTTLFLFLLGGLVGTFVGDFIAQKFIYKDDEK